MDGKGANGSDTNYANWTRQLPVAFSLCWSRLQFGAVQPKTTQLICLLHFVPNLPQVRQGDLRQGVLALVNAPPFQDHHSLGFLPHRALRIGLFQGHRERRREQGSFPLRTDL